MDEIRFYIVPENKISYDGDLERIDIVKLYQLEPMIDYNNRYVYIYIFMFIALFILILLFFRKKFH
jgi:hypothetical protein